MCNQDKKLQYYIYVNISEGNGARALWTISSPNTFYTWNVSIQNLSKCIDTAKFTVREPISLCHKTG